MKEIIYNIIQLSLALFIAILILLQQKGSGLGQVFGGTGNVYATRRGLDKIFHYATIILTFLFFSFSLLRLVI